MFIGPNVSICEGAVIGDGAVLQGNNYVGRFAKIGEDSFLFPTAVVMDYCELGKRVRLQPGAVIGSDGYGYVFVDGKHVKVPQVGKVVVEDDAEIGANTCIDRARFETTLVGAGTKIDNLVQVAHNVQIGKGALLVSQVGISGSTSVGDFAVLGGQVGVAGHLKIGAGAMIGGQSGVNGDIPPKSYMRGTPPRPYLKRTKSKFSWDTYPNFTTESRTSKNISESRKKLSAQTNSRAEIPPTRGRIGKAAKRGRPNASARARKHPASQTDTGYFFAMFFIAAENSALHARGARISAKPAATAESTASKAWSAETSAERFCNTPSSRARNAPQATALRRASSKNARQSKTGLPTRRPTASRTKTPRPRLS